MVVVQILTVERCTFIALALLEIVGIIPSRQNTGLWSFIHGSSGKLRNHAWGKHVIAQLEVNASVERLKASV